MRILAGGALVALAAATTGARAADTVIGGASINLPPPAAFCELSPSNPADERMVTTVEGLVAQSGNKLLSMSADCQQLADWRATKRPFLDDYGQYQTLVSQMDQLVASPEAAIRDACATFRTEGNQIVSDTTPDAQAAIAKALKTVRMNSPSFAGVLAEDQTACYAGEIQKLQTDKGTEKTQIVLIAVTVVKNKYIYLYRMAAYTGSDAVTALLAKFKDTVAALYAANK